jgi:hypothetical protein
MNMKGRGKFQTARFRWQQYVKKDITQKAEELWKEDR